MGKLAEKLKQNYSTFKQQQKQKAEERRKLEAEIKVKEQAAFNKSYAESIVAEAKRKGREAGRRGKNSTWGTLSRVGEGFIGAAEAMYPEYTGKRAARKGKKKKGKRDPYNILEF